jgi:uncharacterized protein
VQTPWLDLTETYDGSQLHPTWIGQHVPLHNTAICAFVGPARVEAEHMVDLEDIANEAWIYSDSMLHFLAAHTDTDLERMVLRQHLFVGICAETIHLHDLFVGTGKLSVSIATTSASHGLMHTGLNITTSGTPVETAGLAALDIAPQAFATTVMQEYAATCAAVRHACGKVKPVT